MAFEVQDSIKKSFKNYERKAKSKALNAVRKGDSKKMLEHKAENRRLRHESFKEINNFTHA